MRKIIAGEFISLDGVIDSPHEWHFPYWSDEMGAEVGAQMSGTDTMLLGRVTWEGFAAFWPDKTEPETPAADHMNNTPKYVVSTTLTNVDAWQNSTLLGGADPLAQVAALKQQPGGDIGISGSGQLVQSLIDAGLLDELRLLVHPIVVGHGTRLFRDGAKQTGLQLAASKTLPNGVLALTYTPAGS